MSHRVYPDNGVYRCEDCAFEVEVINGRIKYITHGEAGVIHTFSSVGIGFLTTKTNPFERFINTMEKWL